MTVEFSGWVCVVKFFLQVYGCVGVSAGVTPGSVIMLSVDELEWNGTLFTLINRLISLGLKCAIVTQKLAKVKRDFPVEAFSLFMRHPIEIIIIKKTPLLICVHYLTARLEVLWFLLILCHSFKLSSLNKASCHYREYKPFHQHSRLRHNKLPVKSPVITGGQIRNWWRIHCSCLSFLECS